MYVYIVMTTKSLQKNNNNMKMIEKIASNPMVDEIYKDSDGYWVMLKEGFHWFHGQIMHEYTLRDMLSALKSVEPVNK